ncbi:MAG: hypothetical protein JW913_09945 [Chitinispirillaceae bacterium]|nr:hypothetical protein [Chitinispirillaceae bacterium]
MKTPRPEEIHLFRSKVYRYFRYHGRTLPWRSDYDPYHIFVSEVMLQQTQVDRVIDKFAAFIERFPDIAALAASPLEAVFACWQGLGYNRRAVALHRAAKVIVREHDAIVPKDPEALRALPGIGPATAASIAAFAYNQPTLFLETNIRTVFIHHFFNEQKTIDDAAILPIAAAALDRCSPRRWYSALMDYGAMLKKEVGNLSRRSTGYKKQPPFAGSRRQVRGAILRLLLGKGRCSAGAIIRTLKTDSTTVTLLLETLTAEGFLKKEGRWYLIVK